MVRDLLSSVVYGMERLKTYISSLLIVSPLNIYSL